MQDTRWLATLFPNVHSLRDWADSQHELTVLDSLVVAWREEPSPAPSGLPHDFQALIDFAHRHNTARARGNDAWRHLNIFSTGKNANGVVREQNTTAASIRLSKDWAELCKLLGPSRTFQLLTHYFVFSRLPNKCFQQLAGPPVQNLTALTVPRVRQTVDVIFARSSVFYRSTWNKGHGLPADHPLYADDIKSGSDAAIRALQRRIFPRQYGLHNVFEPAGPVREAVKKTPTILKGQLAILLREFLHRHKRYDYLRQLKRFCPSTLARQDFTQDEEDAIVALATQEPFAPTCTAAASQALSKLALPTPKAKYQDHQPCFLDAACPPSAIAKYVTRSLFEVVPFAMIGSEWNKNVMEEFIKSFTRAKRSDSISLDCLSREFRWTDCAFLQPRDETGAKNRIDRTSALQRQQAAHELLYFLVNDFVIPLLRRHFFITEASSTRNQVFYFRNDDWAAICKPVLAKLKTTLYERLPEDVKVGNLGFAPVRLLPKERGVRPIVNLSRKPRLSDGTVARAQSINERLSDAKSVLAFEHRQDPGLTGAAVSSPCDLVELLINLKEQLGDRLGQGRLYFVKVDIKACFDTISQDKLVEVLRRVLIEKDYLISTHMRTGVKDGRPFSRFRIRNAHDSDDGRPVFSEEVVKMAESVKRKIFIDRLSLDHAASRDVITVLCELVQSSLVIIHGRLHRQTTGIPQGAVVSAMLCNIFYADFERELFGKLIRQSTNLLARMVDDFLFITTRREDAELFLGTMLDGVAEYGCTIAPQKSVINFEPSRPKMEGVRRLEKDDDFAWCGLVVDQRLNVRLDIARQRSTHIADTMTIATGRAAGKQFQRKIKMLASYRMHKAVLDPRLNSPASIQLSYYQILVILAKRMYAYAFTSLSPSRDSLLRNRHAMLVDVAVKLIEGKGGLQPLRALEASHRVELAVAAFEAAWSKKRPHGLLLLASFKRRLMPHRARHRRRLRPMIAAPSNALLDGIRF